MYAIVDCEGQQQRVEIGQTIELNRLAQDVGEQVEFDRVLLVKDDENTTHVGSPYLDGWKVSGTVKSLFKGKKVNVVKFKRRKNYLRRAGHRQHLAQVVIDSISG